MPCLPSGKHIGLDPSPLFALMARCEAQKDASPLLGMTVWYHLDPWVEIVWLEPADESGASTTPTSLPLPEQMRPRPTGFCLDKSDSFADSLSAEDAAAFRDFLSSERVIAQICMWLSLASALGRQIANGPYGWDESDLLAALLKLDKVYVAGLIPAEVETRFLDAVHGFLEELRPCVPEATRAEYMPGSVSGFGRLIRERRALPSGTERQEIVHAMLLMAWHMTGELWLEDLRPYEAEAIDIISLAGLGYDPATKKHRSLGLKR